MIRYKLSRAFLGLAGMAAVAVSGPPSLGQQQSAEVDGFRSAKFQMTEEQVRQAINADFKAAAAKIQKRTENVTRTPVLSIQVPDLIPDRGTARVNYTFGYKSNRLIQVDVIWNKTVDPKITPEMLRAVLGNLGATLRDRGFAKEKTVVNAATNSPNVVVLFRGEDEKGRVVALVGRFKVDPKAEEGKRVKFDEPESAILSYMLNTKSPDVYKLEPGKF
jgi:hypothetical protein